MIRKLYKTIVPEFIRTEIFAAHYKDIMTGIMQSREEEELEFRSSVPYIELSPNRIANLQVVINREALLHFMPKRAVVAEIGVWKGDFSSSILSITKPEKLYLIDPWDTLNEDYKEKASFVRDRFREEIESGKVIINKGYSFTELEKFNDGYFDWIYIDSDHTYKTTVRELELCRIKVKENGIIAGHDYCTWSIMERMRYGVIEAVNEFCEKHDWEMIYLTHEAHRFISFALRKCTS